MKKFLLGLLLAASSLAAQHSVTLTITWSQGLGDPATGFNIWRVSNTAGATCPVISPTGTPFASIPITTTTYVDTAVSAGQTFCYGVTSANGLTNSAMSNEVSCTIPFVLTAPGVSASVK